MGRTRSIVRVFIGALGLSSLVLPRLASASETGMGPAAIYSQNVTGDFVVAGNNTRQFGVTTAQTNPFNIVLSGIPAGASVIQAYANWQYQTNAPGAASEANILVNGNGVTGALTGVAAPDFNWGHTNSDAYTADITSLVTGNGTYTITGAVDSATTVGSYGEGMSILAVWSKAGSPVKNVDVYSGLTSNTGGTATAIYGFDTPYNGGPANFFINALDGQAFADQGLINGVNITGLAGIGPIGNTWEGLVGSDPTDNMYDQATGDVSPYMNFGDASLTLQTTLIGDYIGHSFGAISFSAVPEPTAMAIGLVGASFALLRRRSRRM
jgi:hypothetical protein